MVLFLERMFGMSLSEEERARRHTELYGPRAPLPPRGTGLHSSKNLKQSVVIGVATGGVVYGLAKWKERWVQRYLHIDAKSIAPIAGVAGFGISYWVL